mmetsp:Transcript_31705/g.79202  ORF Transcript_31705/g.79202 Transcript_31705/m.79202 type:complete len:211 (-) Transcript_31705:7-639(-)
MLLLISQHDLYARMSQVQYLTPALLLNNRSNACIVSILRHCECVRPIHRQAPKDRSQRSLKVGRAIVREYHNRVRCGRTAANDCGHACRRRLRCSSARRVRRLWRRVRGVAYLRRSLARRFARHPRRVQTELLVLPGRMRVELASMPPALAQRAIQHAKREHEDGAGGEGDRKEQQLHPAEPHHPPLVRELPRSEASLLRLSTLFASPPS